MPTSVESGASLARSLLSRRSLLVSVAGAAAITLIDGPLAWASPNRTSRSGVSRPTVVWVKTEKASTGLRSLWGTKPEHLSTEASFRPQDAPSLHVYVSNDRLVQLHSGVMLSLIAVREAGAWRYGVADLPRVTREGWRTHTIVDKSGRRSSTLLVAAAAKMQGHRASLSLRNHAVMKVRQD